MATEATPPAGEQQPPATDGTTAPEGQQQPDEQQLGEQGKKALDQERRARREAERTLAQMQQRLQEFEDRDKTETERLGGRLSAAERERDEARAELARLRIGLRHGLSEDDLELLGTGTEEELEARAKRVAELAAAAAGTQPTPPPARPQEQLRPGAAPAGTDPALNGDPLLASLKSKLGIP